MSFNDGAALIAGTAIGGGFLALPAVTAPIGVAPTVLCLLLVWSFYALGGVALVEATGVALARIEKRQSRDAAAKSAGDVSFPSLTASTLPSLTLLCSGAFAAQMLAIVTAQVVKAGEILYSTAALPYEAGALLVSVGLGLAAFGAEPRAVERLNTALTGALLLGFAALLATTLLPEVGVGPESESAYWSAPPGVVAAEIYRAKWSMLVPSAGGADAPPWAVPIVLNLLSFGQSVPLLVSRMCPPGGSAAARGVRLRRARDAMLAGSAVPLGMGIAWAAVTTYLFADPNLQLLLLGGADPVIALMGARPATSVPIELVAAGAIGTTMLSANLAIEGFATDAFRLANGAAAPADSRRTSRVLTVAIPALCALAGPSLYLPLLGFSGAFPTTLLYGVVPPLALLTLRESARVDGGSVRPPQQQLLPGGEPVLTALGAVAVGLLAINAWLAIVGLLDGGGISTIASEASPV